MKGIDLAWVVGFPVVLLCSCMDANIVPKRDADDPTAVEKAGARTDAESVPGDSSGCDKDERLGSHCSIGEGACRQQGEYVCESGKVICKASLTPAENRADCDDVVDDACEEACMGAQDGGTVDEDRIRDMRAADGVNDHDAGLVDIHVDAEEATNYPQWEPTFCEGSFEDCLCLRGVCLPADCSDYDPAVFVAGFLFNEETPATGADICYHSCQREADCPEALPVCVFEIEVWSNDSTRSKGCYPM